jgi:hypothetical protein
MWFRYLSDEYAVNIKNNIIANNRLSVRCWPRMDPSPSYKSLIDSNFYAYSTSGLYGSKTFYPDSAVFYINPYPAMLNLVQWQVYTLGKDVSSTEIPVYPADSLLFFYNISKHVRIITLPRPMKDLKGVKYWKYIILYPYTSSILRAD